MALEVPIFSMLAASPPISLILPSSLMIRSPTHADGGKVIETTIADDYIALLVESGNPLGGSARLQSAQHDRARVLVARAVGRLRGEACLDSHDINSAMARFLKSGATPGDAFAAQKLLIATALPAMCEHLDLSARTVIAILIDEIYADFALAFEEVLRLAPAPETQIEIVDRDRMLSDGISRRELEVFECVLRNASNKEISEALKIQPYTVKNHIRALGRKLSSGRSAMLRHARAVGYLIAIPVAAATPVATDVISSWPDLA